MAISNGEGEMPQPGWYPDPEAPDLDRWWDGREWSDTDFRPPPRGGALQAVVADYVDSYRDQLPNSPANGLARSTLIASFIELVAAVALLVVVIDLRATMLPTVPAILLAAAGVCVAFLAIWNVLVSSVAIVNARRHDGARLRESLVALACSCLAAGCGVWALFEALPHAYGVLSIAW